MRTNQPITLSTTLINTGYEKFDKGMTMKMINVNLLQR